METNEIIKLAAMYAHIDKVPSEEIGQFYAEFNEANLIKFANEISALQREIDAKICDLEWNGDSDTFIYSEARNDCASAIRGK